MDAVLENPRVALGDNQPPEPTPFELVRDRIEDLCLEARNWADGAAIATQAQADEISFLVEQLRKAEAAAEAQRKIEAKPFDDGKAEVQARYNPLIQEKKGKTALAILACKATLAPWLLELERQAAVRAAEAKRIADEAAVAAIRARREADPANLEQIEQARELTQQAEGAAHDAKWAEGQKAQARGGARAMSLRSYFTPRLTDGTVAASHYWLTRREDCEAFFLQLARSDVASGARAIPGFAVDEERRPV